MIWALDVDTPHRTSAAASIARRCRANCCCGRSATRSISCRRMCSTTAKTTLLAEGALAALDAAWHERHDYRASLDALAADDLLRRRVVLDAPSGPEAVVDGQRLIAFAGNDYLGLASSSGCGRGAARRRVSLGRRCGRLASGERTSAAARGTRGSARRLRRHAAGAFLFPPATWRIWPCCRRLPDAATP
jgi:hypothetical protein